MKLRRKIDQKLAHWKKSRRKKPLLITGARQTGKTFAAREYGTGYASFIEINFLENPEYIPLFEQYHDPRLLKRQLMLLNPDWNFVHGETLLFLDEVQECPDALTSLKFWKEEESTDVICSGSALGLAYSGSSSFPVGFVDEVHMTGLDFEEFLWSRNIPEDSVSLIRESLKAKTAMNSAVHQRLMDLLKEYMVVGGMPEAVSEWADSQSLTNVHKIQRSLYNGYIADIAHYASPEIQIKAQNCYKSIGDQLFKPNHKFQYSKVEKGANAEKFGNSLDWLEKADFTYAVCNLKAVEFPLDFLKDTSDFRIYPTDIGMLMAPLSLSVLSALLTDQSFEGVPANLGTYKGPLYEALAFDILYKSGAGPIYFYKPKKREMEIEFIVEKDGQICPLEIKAGRSRSRSLDTLLKESPELTGYKCSNRQFGIHENKITIPLYALPFLFEQQDEI